MIESSQHVLGGISVLHMSQIVISLRILHHLSRRLDRNGSSIADIGESLIERGIDYPCFGLAFPDLKVKRLGS